jgi:hypothetical protein
MVLCRTASRDVRLALGHGVAHLSVLALAQIAPPGDSRPVGVDAKSCAWRSSSVGQPSGKSQAATSAAVVPMLIMGWSTAAEGDEVMRCVLLLTSQMWLHSLW